MRSISVAGLLLAVSVGVCVAQAPPIDSLTAAATAVTVSGQVSVLKDSEPWAIQAGTQVRPRQIIIAGPDGYALFRLSDGSSFEVFPNSRVTFRSTPGDWTDLLELLLGRIKVRIQKWGGQPNPNKIRTPTALISVRGTVFDVLVEDGDSTLVSVEEGQVVVSHLRQPGDAKLLNSGESIRVYKDVPLSQRTIDKGSIVQAALRAMADAIYSTIYQNPRTPAPSGGGGGAGGGGGGLPGDRGQDKQPPSPGDKTGSGTPPPPPPPPPPGP